MTVRPFGDRALLLELEQRIDPALVDTARAIADAWEARGLGEAIPAYASVVLAFDPADTPPPAAAAIAAELAGMGPRPAAESGRLVEIPTIYDGPDLEEVAAASGLGRDEVVALHSGREYRAFFLGFLPGFAYCGMLDRRIVAPRLPAPRARVPSGAVAIADGQTGVYPVASPGGWRIVGRTELRVFDPTAPRPALIAPGDRVRFVAR